MTFLVVRRAIQLRCQTKFRRLDAYTKRPRTTVFVPVLYCNNSDTGADRQGGVRYTMGKQSGSNYNINEGTLVSGLYSTDPDLNFGTVYSKSTLYRPGTRGKESAVEKEAEEEEGEVAPRRSLIACL
jgi:hypothetical protein